MGMRKAWTDDNTTQGKGGGGFRLMINPQSSSYKSDFAIAELIIFDQELSPNRLFTLHQYMYNPSYSRDPPILTHFMPTNTYIDNSFVRVSTSHTKLIYPRITPKENVPNTSLLNN